MSYLIFFYDFRLYSYPTYRSIMNSLLTNTIKLHNILKVKVKENNIKKMKEEICIGQCVSLIKIKH